MANIVINSIDYTDKSAKKLFFKYREVRPLADIERKYKYREPDSPLLPRNPARDGRWTAGSSDKYPHDIVTVGIREMHRGLSAPTRHPGKRSALSSRSKSGKMHPLTVHGASPRPTTCPSSGAQRGPLLQTDPTSGEKRGKPRRRISEDEERISAVNSLKPVVAPISTHMRIRVDKQFMRTLADNEKVNFKLKQIWDPHNHPLDEGSDYSKGAKAKTVVDSTTEWLSFAGGEMEPEGLGGLINAFTNNNPPMQYYKIENETGCLVAKQLDEASEVHIGINGIPAPSSKPFSVRNLYDDDPEFSYEQDRDKKLTQSFPDEVPVPLSWDDQVNRPTAKVLAPIGPQPKRTNSFMVDRQAVRFDYERDVDKQRPKVCDPKCTNPIEDREYIYFTKQTRALNNRFVVIEDEEKKTLEKKREEGLFTYEDVLECLKEKQRLRDHLDAQMPTFADINQSNVFSAQLDSARSKPPDSAPHDKGEATPPPRGALSAGTSRGSVSNMLLASSSGGIQPMPMSPFAQSRADDFLIGAGGQGTPEIRSPRMPDTPGRSQPSTSRTPVPPPRPAHGAMLHKTAAATGATIGAARQGPAEYIQIVSSIPGVRQSPEPLDRHAKAKQPMKRQSPLPGQTSPGVGAEALEQELKAGGIIQVRGSTTVSVAASKSRDKTVSPNKLEPETVAEPTITHVVPRSQNFPVVVPASTVSDEEEDDDMRNNPNTPVSLSPRHQEDLTTDVGDKLPDESFQQDQIVKDVGGKEEGHENVAGDDDESKPEQPPSQQVSFSIPTANYVNDTPQPPELTQ